MSSFVRWLERNSIDVGLRVMMGRWGRWCGRIHTSCSGGRGLSVARRVWLSQQGRACPHATSCHIPTESSSSSSSRHPNFPVDSNKPARSWPNASPNSIPFNWKPKSSRSRRTTLNSTRTTARTRRSSTTRRMMCMRWIGGRRYWLMRCDCWHFFVTFFLLSLKMYN